jgi:hypothetical protein
VAGFSLRRRALGVLKDECGTNTSMTRLLRARAPKGERAYTARCLATLRHEHDADRFHDARRGDGRLDGHRGGHRRRSVFEVYVEHFLRPSLSEGQVVVMDKLPTHRTQRVRQLIEERGAELLRFLPSYSPDLKWDEKAETTLRMEPTMVSASKS